MWGASKRAEALRMERGPGARHRPRLFPAQLRRQLEERFGESPFPRRGGGARAAAAVQALPAGLSRRGRFPGAQLHGLGGGSLQRLVPRSPREAHRPLPLLARVKADFSASRGVCPAKAASEDPVPAVAPLVLPTGPPSGIVWASHGLQEGPAPVGAARRLIPALPLCPPGLSASAVRVSSICVCGSVSGPAAAWCLVLGLRGAPAPPPAPPH